MHSEQTLVSYIKSRQTEPFLPGHNCQNKLVVFESHFQETWKCWFVDNGDLVWLDKDK